MKKKKFYTFHQNNTFGYWTPDMPHYMVIEAYNEIEANIIAEENGIYFHGVSKGIDCECCGNRWHPIDEEDGTDTPIIFGEPAETYDGNVKIVYLKAQEKQE